MKNVFISFSHFYLRGVLQGILKMLYCQVGGQGFYVSSMNDKKACYDKLREACSGNYKIICDSRINKFTSELLIECQKNNNLKWYVLKNF